MEMEGVKRDRPRGGYELYTASKPLSPVYRHIIPPGSSTNLATTTGTENLTSAFQDCKKAYKNNLNYYRGRNKLMQLAQQ